MSGGSAQISPEKAAGWCPIHNAGAPTSTFIGGIPNANAYTSMSDRPWYPRYPRDFRAKTMHLDCCERGVYNSLLDHYYELGVPLPCDADALCRIAGAFSEAERRAVDRVSCEFFTNGDGKLTNQRCEEELAKFRARSEQQAELARRRWDNDAKAHAKALPTQSHGNASHSHSHISDLEVQSESKTHHKRKEGYGGKTKKTLAQAPFVLPDWISKDHWKNWVDARTKKRNAPTVFAMELAVTKLEWLKEQGHHPSAVLAQSAFNGWAGLFPVKEGI